MDHNEDSIKVFGILCLYPYERFPGANPSSVVLGQFDANIVLDPEGEKAIDIDNLRRAMASSLTSEQEELVMSTHSIIAYSPRTGTLILTSPP